MKIGIIVYSQTGNTYSVALKLKDKLSSAGHSVGIERLQAVGTVRPGLKGVKLKSIPDTGKYDALVFASPVQGFSMSTPMESLLTNISSLKGKKAACFVTHFFPLSSMGGEQSVNGMKRLCEAKNASVCFTGVVDWMFRPARNKKINEVVDKIADCFK